MSDQPAPYPIKQHEKQTIAGLLAPYPHINKQLFPDRYVWSTQTLTHNGGERSVWQAFYFACDDSYVIFSAFNTGAAYVLYVTARIGI